MAPRSDPNEAPAVSVIVPARNAESSLPRFAAALERQTLAAGQFEMILIDDGSEDGTAEAAEAVGFTVIRLPEHSGPYVARNAGARTGGAQIFAFTDVDCEPAADWLERGVAAFEDPAVELVGGQIDVPLGDRPSLTAILDVCNFVNQERAVAAGFALGGNLWVRRAGFERIGGFNDRLLSGGDQEFTRRAVAEGIPLTFARDVRVAHEPYRRARGLARKARRIGLGAAAHRVEAHGPLRNRSLMCNRPRHYFPRRHLPGLDRLEGTGVTLDRRGRAALLAWRYLFVQMPMVLGNLQGALSRPRRRVPRAG